MKKLRVLKIEEKVGDSNQICITAEKTKSNPLGVYKFNREYVERKMRNAGIPSYNSLVRNPKHITLCFDEIVCKVGESFTRKDGTTGTYTGNKIDGGDWVKQTNITLEITEAYAWHLDEAELIATKKAEVQKAANAAFGRPSVADTTVEAETAAEPVKAVNPAEALTTE